MWFLSFTLMVIAETGYINSLDGLNKFFRRKGKQLINKRILLVRKLVSIAFYLGAFGFTIVIIIIPVKYAPLVMFSITIFFAMLWQIVWKILQSQR